MKTSFNQFCDNEDEESSIISSSLYSSKQNSKLKDSFIFTDFNEAFNAVFNRDCQNEIEGEEEMRYHDEIIEPPIVVVSEGNIIPELTNVVIKKQIFKEKKEKFYPFHEGSGVPKVMENLGLNMTQTKSGEVRVSLYKEQKFETKLMMKDKSGKMKKLKKRRKYKPDNIRKKIKARFHKDLREIINYKLKKSHSKLLFALLPQSFITNITIKLNKKVMGMTYGTLLEKDCLNNTNEKVKNSDKENIIKNKEVLEYLYKDKEICEKSEFKKIKNMKYEELLKAYFSSEEFEKSLTQLYDKNKEDKREQITYLEEYINKAISYVDFFKNNE